MEPATETKTYVPICSVEVIKKSKKSFELPTSSSHNLSLLKEKFAVNPMPPLPFSELATNGQGPRRWTNEEVRGKYIEY
jgi:hypothetical protein